jgi:hypothetical protein
MTLVGTGQYCCVRYWTSPIDRNSARSARLFRTIERNYPNESHQTKGLGLVSDPIEQPGSTNQEDPRANGNGAESIDYKADNDDASDGKLVTLRILATLPGMLDIIGELHDLQHVQHR